MGGGYRRRSGESRILLSFDFKKSEVRAYLLAQLEDGQTDGHDEREERQLQRVPGLQSEDSERHRDQGHGLQQDEHHDRDDDLLQLGLAGFDGAASSVGGLRESDGQGELLVVDVAGRNGNLGVRYRKLEGDIVTLQVLLDGVQGSTADAARSISAESVAVHLDVISELKASNFKLRS